MPQELEREQGMTVREVLRLLLHPALSRVAYRWRWAGLRLQAWFRIDWQIWWQERWQA